MMCDARLFGPQIMEFGKTRAVHLPPISGHDTVEALAAEILEHAPKSFALAGLSMGGIVAMEVFRQAPLRVSRMCLMDTNALPETPVVAAAREPQIVKVMAGRLQEVMADEMKPNYLAPGDGRQAVLDLVLDMALGLGEGVFLRQSRALQRRPDQQPTIRRLRVPTLFICGEHDTLCPVSRHQFMADLVGHAKLEVIAGAGHVPTLEQPEAVTTAMKRWLTA
jgi:pimeloyl-ACP methyl ester carboxylesterase